MIMDCRDVTVLKLVKLMEVCLVLYLHSITFNLVETMEGVSVIFTLNHFEKSGYGGVWLALKGVYIGGGPISLQKGVVG